MLGDWERRTTPVMVGAFLTRMRGVECPRTIMYFVVEVKVEGEWTRALVAEQPSLHDVLRDVPTLLRGTPWEHADRRIRRIESDEFKDYWLKVLTQSHHPCPQCGCGTKITINGEKRIMQCGWCGAAHYV